MFLSDFSDFNDGKLVWPECETTTHNRVILSYYYEYRRR